jgi:hypothetical protein
LLGEQVHVALWEGEHDARFAEQVLDVEADAMPIAGRSR